jgi:DNA repair protein RecO (recombination protein O)
VEINTRGIVLNSIRYGDSSLIVKIFTEELGNLSFMVKGARQRHTSRAASHFGHLNLLDMNFRFRENRELQYLGEVQTLHSYSSLPQNPIKGSIILFINELLLKSIKEEEKNPSLFSFIFDALLWFDEEEHAWLDFHLAFAVKLVEHLGFMPQGSWGPETPRLDMQEGLFVYSSLPNQNMDSESSRDFSALRFCPFAELSSLGLTTSRRRRLLSSLIDYYRHHLPSFSPMKSLSVLEEIYS